MPVATGGLWRIGVVLAYLFPALLCANGALTIRASSVGVATAAFTALFLVVAASAPILATVGRRRRQQVKWLAVYLLLVGASGIAYVAVGVTKIVERPQLATAPQCGAGEIEVFMYNFGSPAGGDAPASAVRGTAEAAVKDEADQLMVAHDERFEREGNRYIVYRGGRPAAVFATEKRSGRYVVTGGEVCSADAAPR